MRAELESIYEIMKGRKKKVIKTAPAPVPAPIPEPKPTPTPTPTPVPAPIPAPVPKPELQAVAKVVPSTADKLVVYFGVLASAPVEGTVTVEQSSAPTGATQAYPWEVKATETGANYTYDVKTLQAAGKKSVRFQLKPGTAYTVKAGKEAAEVPVPAPVVAPAPAPAPVPVPKPAEVLISKVDDTANIIISSFSKQ